MKWQDVVFSVGQVVFVVALIPTARGRQKPAMSTSVVTAAILAAFAFTYMTLSLWFSAATTAVTSLTWLILALQSRGQVRHRG